MEKETRGRKPMENRTKIVSFSLNIDEHTDKCLQELQSYSDGWSRTGLIRMAIEKLYFDITEQDYSERLTEGLKMIGKETYEGI